MDEKWKMDTVHGDESQVRLGRGKMDGEQWGFREGSLFLECKKCEHTSCPVELAEGPDGGRGRGVIGG